ncbi:hypothetical protein GCM10027516_18340 [Niabella aquatica]
MGWQGRALGNVIAFVFFGIVSIFLLSKRGYIKFSYNSFYIKDALNFGLPLIPHTLSIWMRSGLDKFLITKYVGEASNGLYSTGFQFGTLLGFVTIAFNNAFIPFLFKKLSTEDQDKLKSIKKQIVRLSYGIMIVYTVCGIILALGAIVLLNIFFSNEYQGASEFIFWAMLVQVFQGMYLLVCNYIFFARRTKFLPVITFLCGIFQLGLSYFLINNIGAIGAAYSAVIVSFFNFLAVWYYSNKVYAMPWFAIKSKKTHNNE